MLYGIKNRTNHRWPLIKRFWIIKFIIFFYISSNYLDGPSVVLACTFQTQMEPESHGVRFIRVREDLRPGTEILLLNAYPRTSLLLKGVERSNDHKYFRINELNATTVQIILNKSLDFMVDQDIPQNLLKFRLLCTGNNQGVEETAFLAVTVYVEDINDHSPEFQNTPYEVFVDETMPVGSVIFNGIRVFDRDKPNTPNSDVQITLGQDQIVSSGEPYFLLENPHSRPHVILKRQLDFDSGSREFILPIFASDRGSPSKQSNATLRIFVADNDDLPPKFTEGVYRTKINEYFPMTGKSVHMPLYFAPQIKAFDQDSLNATLIYDIISGNERQLFSVNPNSGTIYLNKEVDLEEESLPGNTFVLQLEARQEDDPLKRALARIEIEIMDLNDNSPEFEVDLYNISIVENLPSGFSVLQVNAYDKDQGENAEFFYNMSSEIPAGAFLIDPRSGWLTVRNQTLLDREQRRSIKMIVEAIERIPAYDQRANSSGTVQVEITLLDSNDNTPKFENGNLYEFRVGANAEVGSVIGQVKALDPDEGRNGLISYDLQRPKGSGYIPFRLDTDTGTLYVAGPLHKGKIALFVEASDQPHNPSERRFSLAVVTIEVHSIVKEGSIDFIGSPYEFWVGSDVSVGTSVGQVRVSLDEDDGHEVMYDLLHSYSEGVPFAVEERSGIVTVIRDLDDFNRNLYYFEAVANYGITTPMGRVIRRTSRQEKQITKNGHVFEIDEGIISDHENVLLTNLTVHVVSPDDERGVLLRGSNLTPIEFHVKENLRGAIIGRLFHRNQTSVVSKHVAQQKSVSLEEKKGTRNKRSWTENGYMFPTLQPYHTIETTAIMEYFTDPYVPEETRISPVFQPSPSRKQSTWRPTFMNSKNRKVESSSAVPINSKHATTPATQSYRRIIKNETLVIHDSRQEGNQSKPIYEKAMAETFVQRTPQKSRLRAKQIAEPSESESSTSTITKNQMGLKFVIANQQDVINKISITDDGTLMTLNGLDREEQNVYRLTIIAEYSKGYTNGAGIYQVNIHVDDVNDNAPEFDKDSYAGIIFENSPVGTEILLNNVIKAKDNDAGKNAEFSLTLSGAGSEMFALTQVITSNDTGKIHNPFSDMELQHLFDIEKSFMATQFFFLNKHHLLTPGPYYKLKYVGKGILDHEKQNLYDLSLTAKDLGGLSTSVKLSIVIADANDNAPVFDKVSIFKGSMLQIVTLNDELEVLFVEKMPDMMPPNASVSIVGPEPVFFNGGTPRKAANISTLNHNYHNHQARSLFSPKAYRRSSRASKSKATLIFSIAENVAVGTSILKVSATDDDSNSNAQISYAVTSEIVSIRRKTIAKENWSPHFSIDRLSGELKVIRVLHPETEITLNLTAKDMGGLSDLLTISFHITDVNNHAPIFQRSWYTFDLEEGMYSDHSIDRIEATDEDFGQNANISYRVRSKHENHPFFVNTRTGVLKVSGDLDRETNSKYELQIIAYDNAAEAQRLTSTVEVEINVLDINDNAPEFIGYDDLVKVFKNASNDQQRPRKLMDFDDFSRSYQMERVPVYKAYLNRNSEPGTFVKQISAIDKDFQGNGNGLVMFSLMHHKLPYLFEIDSRDGSVSTISKFNRYDGYEHVNVSIVASDLGSPTKSTNAILLVNLQGEPGSEETEMEIFTNRYYEVEVFENNKYPLKLLHFNTTINFRKESFKWTLYSGDPDIESAFAIDTHNGTLFITKSLDRETKDFYRMKIRADPVLRKSRTASLAAAKLTYPASGDRIEGLQPNEIRVVVKVADTNDNSPIFRGNGRPMVAVIPNTANFGFPVAQVSAVDFDIGINADIRYKLLNEPSKLFGIDERSGQIRVLGPLPSDKKVYGFDVKATDRQGADDGRSSITNVFAYVLDEHRQVRLVVAGKPVEVEQEVDGLMENLSSSTGMDVRIRLLEPHIGVMEPATNAYIYAVDPKTNSLVNMEDLQLALSTVDINNLSLNQNSQILELAELGNSHYRDAENNSAITMSGTELASIILAIIIFTGGLATFACILCARFKRRNLLSTRSDTGGLAYSVHRIPSSTLGTERSKTATATTTTSTPESKRSINYDINRRSTHFTNLAKNSKYVNDIVQPREYVDVPLPKSVINSHLNDERHESSCLQFHEIHNKEKINHLNPVHRILNRDRELSASGHLQQQNLLEMLGGNRSNRPSPHQNHGHHKVCRCDGVDVCYGGDSSDSYEDSLKNGAAYNTTSDGRYLKFESCDPGSRQFYRSVRNPGFEIDRTKPQVGVILGNKNNNVFRHSFSGARNELVHQHHYNIEQRQNQVKTLQRSRTNSFHNSMTDLERRLDNLEKSISKDNTN